MQIRLLVLALGLALTNVACVSSSSLEKAGKLGDTGAKAGALAAQAYEEAHRDVLMLNVQKCVSYVLAQPTDEEGAIACLEQPPESTVLLLADLLDKRAKLFRDLAASHLAFAAEARREQVDLATPLNETMKSASDVFKALDSGSEWDAKPIEKYSGVVSGVVNLFERSQRLNRLKTASEKLEAASEILAQAYQGGVVQSITTISDAKRGDAITALTANNLYDDGRYELKPDDLLDLPVRPLERGDPNWDTDKAESLIALLQAIKTSEARKSKTEKAADLALALHNLAQAHAKFRADEKADISGLLAAANEIFGSLKEKDKPDAK